MNYLLDANTYIQAKNEYYQMNVCPGYWDWLDSQFEAGCLVSVSLVYDELKGFGDELSSWVKERKDQFWMFLTMLHKPSLPKLPSMLPNFKT